MKKFERRYFLQTLLASLSLLLPGRTFANSLSLPAVAGPCLDADLLMSIFRHLESPAKVGRLYLHMNPGEADPQRLEASIVQRLSSAIAPGALTADALHDSSFFGNAVGQAVHEDFGNGDTVNVQGWILSRTEGQLCGLLALTEDRRSVRRTVTPHRFIPHPANSSPDTKAAIYRGKRGDSRPHHGS